MLSVMNRLKAHGARLCVLVLAVQFVFPACAGCRLTAPQAVPTDAPLAQGEPALTIQQEAALADYDIELTPEQISSVNMDAFLHDLSCFFGGQDGSVPYAKPVANSNCERYEGEGYEYCCWYGGEHTLREMRIGEETVYKEEASFPIMDDDSDPTPPPAENNG